MTMGNTMNYKNNDENSSVEEFIDYLEQSSRAMPTSLPEWVS